MLLKREGKGAQAPSCRARSGGAEYPPAAVLGWRAPPTPQFLISGLSPKWAWEPSGNTVLGCPGQQKSTRGVCLVSQF